MEGPIVFFDGVCNFCNYWVKVAIRKDKHKKLQFASLQGETAKNLLPSQFTDPGKLASVILFEKGKVYTLSTAALRICRYLSGGYRMFYILMVVPKFIRDFFYNIISRNRYKWFGKRESCIVPGPEIQLRFLP